MGLRAYVLLIFLVGSLPVCLVRPFYGIVLWCIVAFLNPQSFLWGEARTLPWAQAIAIPTLVGLVVFHRRWANLFTRECILLIILGIWFTVTTVAAGRTPMFTGHAPEMWEKWENVSKILLMAVVTAVAVDSFARLRILLLTIAGCFGFFVAKSVPFVILSAGSHRVYGPEGSMIADNNDFGLAMNMTLAVFFFMAQTETGWLKRVMQFLFIGTIPVILFTYSRGALVGLVAVLGLMFLRLRQRFALLPVIVLAGLLGIMFAPEKWRERMDPTSDQVLDRSAQGRLNAWAFSWNLALDHPLTGGGYEAYTPELFARYAPVAWDVHGPHSVYFQLMGEHGLFGFFLYLVLIASCFATASRLLRRAKLYGDEVVQKYVTMIQFSMVGFLTSGLFLGRAYFDYFFTFVVCLAALKTICANEWNRIDMDTQVAEAEVV